MDEFLARTADLALDALKAAAAGVGIVLLGFGIGSALLWLTGRKRRDDDGGEG